jgi:hypothetical protein
MINVTEQLKAQNNGTAWLDCNRHATPHRWRFSHRIVGANRAYWRCLRCPVTTFTVDGEQSARTPNRFL